MDFVESTSSEPEETRTVDVTSEAAAEGSQESQGFTFNESSLGLSQQEESMLTTLLNDSVSDNAIASPGKGMFVNITKIYIHPLHSRFKYSFNCLYTCEVGASLEKVFCLCELCVPVCATVNNCTESDLTGLWSFTMRY